jgi:hypothetical protein
MSIEYCETCDLEYDSDFEEHECPEDEEDEYDYESGRTDEEIRGIIGPNSNPGRW